MASEGAFTPLYEEDADKVAPLLAKRSIAGAVYLLLVSRVFRHGGKVRVSETHIAQAIGASRSATHIAVKALESDGLLTVETGSRGCIFSVPHIRKSSVENSVENRISGAAKTLQGCSGNATSGAAKTLQPIYKKKDIKNYKKEGGEYAGDF